MPDRARRDLTPGSFDPTATNLKVCLSGYARQRRPNRWVMLKLKGQAMRRYGLALTPANWHAHVLDHLVPLELGGLPTDPANLWPQTKLGARLKDVDENAQKRAVCAGHTDLAAAQQFFMERWTA